MSTKVPTRSPTDEEVPMARLASMAMELDDIADGGQVDLSALVEMAEDRGRPPSHYVAAIPHSDVTLAMDGPLALRVCVGNCQRYGARDLVDVLVERAQAKGGFSLHPVECLDRCDLAPACEIDGPSGKLVLAPATKASLAEALDSL